MDGGSTWPVGGELDPAVPRRRLTLDLGHKLVGLDFDAEVPDVAVWTGDVPAGPDQARQVLALLDGAVVDR